MFSWHLHVSSRCYASSTDSDLPRNTRTAIGNLGNECADHAAALGAIGLVSTHNLATRWVRHNFDTPSSFGACNNIGQFMKKLRSIRTETASLR